MIRLGCKCVFACIIPAIASAAALCAEISPETALRKKIAEGSYEERKDAIETHKLMGDAIVQGLIDIGKDEKRTAEDRIEAIIRLSEFPCKESIDFLLRNIKLHIRPPMIRFISEWEFAKLNPCLFALKEMGWPAIPDAIDFLGHERDADELNKVAQVFYRVCGVRTGKAMLEAELPTEPVPKNRHTHERFNARVKEVIKILNTFEKTPPKLPQP